MRGLQGELGEIWPSFVLPGESVDDIGFPQAVLPEDSLPCDRLISLPLVHRFFPIDEGLVLGWTSLILVHSPYFVHAPNIAATCSLGSLS